MRAQLLRSGEEPLAQLLYLGASGAPLALYAKKGEGDAAPAFKRYGALGGVAWSQGGVAYLLAGEGDKAPLLSSPRRSGIDDGRRQGAPADRRTPPTDLAQAEALAAPCRAERRVVAGQIAIEVAPDRGGPLLVAIVEIVLDRSRRPIAACSRRRARSSPSAPAGCPACASAAR